MSGLWSYALAVVVVAAVGLMAALEHRKQVASRRGLLDSCLGLLAHAKLRHGRDGIPTLAGICEGSRVSIELIPDTMTIRRLPQLWMSVTLSQRRDGLPGFAVLVRPAGTEFYSLTSHFTHRLDVPAPLPAEVLIHGENDGASGVLEMLTPCLAKLLRDGRVKEFAASSRGIRIIRQAAEGKRGEHLLLRQASFEDAHVKSEDVEAVLHELLSINNVLAALPVAPPVRMHVEVS